MTTGFLKPKLGIAMSFCDLPSPSRGGFGGLHGPSGINLLLSCFGSLIGPDLLSCLVRFDCVPLVLRIALFGGFEEGRINDLSPSPDIHWYGAYGRRRRKAPAMFPHWSTYTGIAGSYLRQGLARKSKAQKAQPAQMATDQILHVGIGRTVLWRQDKDLEHRHAGIALRTVRIGRRIIQIGGIPSKSTMPHNSSSGHHFPATASNDPINRTARTASSRPPAGKSLNQIERTTVRHFRGA